MISTIINTVNTTTTTTLAVDTSNYMQLYELYGWPYYYFYFYVCTTFLLARFISGCSQYLANINA